MPTPANPNPRAPLLIAAVRDAVEGDTEVRPAVRPVWVDAKVQAEVKVRPRPWPGCSAGRGGGGGTRRLYRGPAPFENGGRRGATQVRGYRRGDAAGPAGFQAKSSASAWAVSAEMTTSWA